MLSRSYVRFNLFKNFALGLRHQEKCEEACPDADSAVQQEGRSFTHDARKRQK
jgi:hypothetical protein